jgi:hypothetical protein
LFFVREIQTASGRMRQSAAHPTLSREGNDPMSYRKVVTTTNELTTKKETQDAAPSKSAMGPVEAALDRALRYADAGEYEKAFDQLANAGKSPQVMNARGVCLLRLGRFDAATRIFREFLLNPGSTWMRPDLPTVYKANYATTLLMGGHPSGCLEMLHEIHDESHPSVQRLRGAIRQWESSLSFWQRLNWRIGKIEPDGRPVLLDFPPGDFSEPVSTAHPPRSMGAT